MKHNQDNLTAASVQQAQSAAKQIAQLYAMIAAKDKRIAELGAKLDRANDDTRQAIIKGINNWAVNNGTVYLQTEENDLADCIIEALEAK